MVFTNYYSSDRINKFHGNANEAERNAAIREMHDDNCNAGASGTEKNIDIRKLTMITPMLLTRLPVCNVMQLIIAKKRSNILNK